MEKNLKYFVIFTMGILVVGFTYLITFPDTFQKDESVLPEHLEELNDNDILEKQIGNEVFQLEVATSIEKRIQGLMGRSSMGKNQGMIFIFEDSAPRIFHMRNVEFSLDMIFLNEEFRVVKIHKSTKINQEEELYASELPAQYVIELLGGSADRVGLSEGMVLEI